MGFRPEPTVYKLNFDDTLLEGLEVSIGCCTMAEFNGMLRQPEKVTAAESADINEKTAAMISHYLVSWNMEDRKGNPVPTTPEGLASVEQTILVQLLTAWQIAMVTVPDPLKKSSSNGGKSEELSLGLGNLSENLGNWPKQS